MSLKTSDSKESFKSKTSLLKQHFKRKSECSNIPDTSSISTSSYLEISPDLSSSTQQPITSTASSSSTLKHSNSTTKKSNDHIKKIIRDYKKLDHGLVKFDSQKNGILKTNILRVTLLPFLRTNSNDIILNCSFNKTISNTAITCLIKWWSSLLNSLTSQTISNPVSSSDRAVYLECISRIITRKEWKLSTQTYQKLLTETLEYSISRLNLKNVSLSTSAFVGKVFAYSFFNLPDVSTALLFLLGVKQITVENLLKQIFVHNNQANSFDSINKALPRLIKLFPQTVRHLVGYSGKHQVPRSEKRFLNATIAPLKPVKGIVDPKGLWVKRWCSFDSDVFCSFLRHYLHIISESIMENADNSTNLNLLPLNTIAAAPGFMIILSHYYETINDSIMQRCKKSAHGEKDFNINIILESSNNIQQQQKANKSIDPTTNISINILKAMKTIRDFLHNSYDESEMMIAPFIVHLYDQVLQCYASKISAYNSELTGYILDVAYEYMVNIVKRTRDSNSSMLLVLSLDWNFWICALQNMLQTSNINCELKLFSILFNIWDLLPSFNYVYRYKQLPKWFTNEQESIKWNVTTWLISFPTFDKYFCHWQPLVRSYYQRLICWRLIVFTNSELAEQDESIRRVIESRLTAIFENLNDLINESTNKIPEMSLSTPMANRKIVINRILQNNEFFISDNLQNEVLSISSENITRKIHAYEIFDDAIYCSNNAISPYTTTPTKRRIDNGSRSSPSPSNSRSSSSTSLVGSALKFFKKPAPISEKEPTSLPPSPPSPAAVTSTSSSSSRISSMLTPPSGISKTFSSLSLSSRSSSPSLMSSSNNTSPPSSSISDLSDLDSLDFKNDTDDTMEEDLDNIHPPLPPELDKRAPEIIRPLYRFQLVFNETGIHKQLQIIKESKFVHRNSVADKTHDEDVPKTVKLPDLQKILNKKETSQYYYIAEEDEDEDEDEDQEEVEEFQDSESFIYMKETTPTTATSSTMTSTRLKKKFSFANSNIHIIGKSINEWNLIVDELEIFLNRYLSSGGDLHHIDKVVPFLTVDYPNKAINAY